MDPISIGLGIVGLGMQLFGGSKASQDTGRIAALSSQSAGLSQGVAADEQAINVQRQQQMQLEARRSTLQNFRQSQQLQAQATASSVAGGSQFGSGLQGGLAGITDTAEENALGIRQGVEIGTNIFGLNTDISGKRIQMAGIQGQIAGLQGKVAQDQGFASLGGSIMKAGPIIGAFGKDIGAGFGNLGGMFMGGGSPSGYGR